MVRKTIERQWPNDIMMIPVANGIFDVVDNKFRAKEHDPETDYFIATPYQKDADPHPWHVFLDHLPLTSETLTLLQKMFGYCLLRNCFYEKAFVFYGQGKGKSTLLYILCQMLGDNNVAAVSLPDMDSPFHVANIYNRLVSIDTTMQDCGPSRKRSRKGTMILKSIISGDVVVGRRKYQDDMQFRPSAKYITVAPSVPDFIPGSPGLHGRFVYIKFTPYIDKIPSQSPNVADVLLRSSAPAILSWALDGLGRLIADKGF